MSIRKLSSEMQNKAELELNENPVRVEDDIRHIQEWFLLRPHLNSIKLDDQLILSFLRGCKFRLHETKQKIDNFYTFRTILLEFYKNRNPFSSEIQSILRSGTILPLPHDLEQKGSRTILVRTSKSDPFTQSAEDVAKLCTMLIDIMLVEEDEFVIQGQTLILDMTGLTMQHIRLLTPMFVKKFLLCMQKSYPIRPNHVYIVNSPKIFKNVFNAAKHLMSEKISNRVVFLQTLDDLVSMLSPNANPKDYEKKSKILDEVAAYWKKKVESYADWFLKEEKNRSNEELRINNIRIKESIFGVEGSFRKLNVD